MRTPGDKWTIDRIRDLIGSSENVRLEFKASKLLEKSKEEIATSLTKEVSAFANTEGGALIIGVEEDKRTRIATGVDQGVTVAEWPRERLQQLIEGNVSPYLVGLRVHPIHAQPDRYERVLYVIDVPAGSTAYQAKDRIYYGRSEFESKPLPDNEVRIRMLRTQIAQAAIIVESVVPGRSAVEEVPMPALPPDAPTSSTPEEESNRWLADHPDLAFSRMRANRQREELAKQGKPLVFDEYLVRYSMKNVGLLNIRAGRIEVRVEAEPGYASGNQNRELEPDFKLYPDQRHSGGEFLKLQLKTGHKFAPGTLRLAWRVYLDNSPPSSGAVDLYDYLAGSVKDSGE